MSKRLILVLAVFSSLNLLADPSGPVGEEPQANEPAQDQPVPAPATPAPPPQIEEPSQTVEAAPGSAAAAFAEIRAEYRKRWDANGNFNSSKKLRDEFIAKQDALAQRFRQEGKVTKSMEVRNSFKKDLAFIVSVVQENGVFSGVMIERNKYDTKEDEASLRFFDVPLLQHGTVLMNYGNVDVISFRADGFNASSGGEVMVRYPTNFKNNTFGETRFNISKNADGQFAFVNADQVEFAQIDLHIWIKPFAGPNFGIDTVTFR